MLLSKVANKEKTDEVLTRFLSGNSLAVNEDSAEASVELQPSTETMRYVKSYGQVNKKKKSRSLYKKVAVIGYFVAIAVLVAVLVYASSISEQNASKIDDFNVEQNLIETSISSVNEETEEGLIEDVIEDKAVALGNSYANGEQIFYSVTPEHKGPITYTTEKNWFDDVCDFFANIFGGK